MTEIKTRCTNFRMDDTYLNFKVQVVNPADSITGLCYGCIFNTFHVCSGVIYQKSRTGRINLDTSLAQSVDSQNPINCGIFPTLVRERQKIASTTK